MEAVMPDLGWLSQTVDVPLWGVLTLAGFQVLTRVLRREVGRRRGGKSQRGS